MKIDKGRYWSAIAWVESVPQNWQKKLKDSGLAVAVSPLHDKDYDENGELQKAHYHVLMCWDGPITLENARSFAEEIGLGSYVERVRSVSNILDYLTHDSFSSKDKHKYDFNDIIWINCNINDFKKMGFKQIIEYIQAKNIKQFSKLVNSLLDNNENDLLEYVSSHTYYVNTYLCSLKNDFDKDIKEAYNFLKGIANDLDSKGKFTLDRKNYTKLLDVFEQLDIFTQ